MGTRHIQHGQRRVWFRPWQVICQCGLDAWPCPAVRIRERQAELMRRPPVAAMGAWQGERRIAALTHTSSLARILDEPTRVLPVLQPRAPAERPLLTPGQAARTRPASR